MTWIRLKEKAGMWSHAGSGLISGTKSFHVNRAHKVRHIETRALNLLLLFFSGADIARSDLENLIGQHAPGSFRHAGSRPMQQERIPPPPPDHPPPRGINREPGPHNTQIISIMTHDNDPFSVLQLLFKLHVVSL